MFGLELLLFVCFDFFVKLKLTVDELQKLCPCEQHRLIESKWHEVSTPILRGQSLTSLILDKLLTINLTLSVANVNSAFKNVSLTFKQLVLSFSEPL